nr:MAG TPA: hypothetical protein [Caudoviricetes sp.]
MLSGGAAVGPRRDKSGRTAPRPEAPKGGKAAWRRKSA